MPNYKESKKIAKISGIGPWVSRINLWEGHWCGSTYMVVRLSDINSAMGLKMNFEFGGSKKCHIFRSTSSQYFFTKISRKWMELNLYGCQAVRQKVILLIKMHFLCFYHQIHLLNLRITVLNSYPLSSLDGPKLFRPCCLFSLVSWVLVRCRHLLPA